MYPDIFKNPFFPNGCQVFRLKNDPVQSEQVVTFDTDVKWYFLFYQKPVPLFTNKFPVRTKRPYQFGPYQAEQFSEQQFPFTGVAVPFFIQQFKQKGGPNALA